MTRTEIETLAVGDFLQNTFDVVAGTGFTKLKENARWSRPYRVTQILVQRDSVDGRAFVLGYTEHGAHSEISFSISEGEMVYRKVDQ
jgi:hypothetical protein